MLINKYIFPGGYIPSVIEVLSYMQSEKLCLTDIESLRRHYGKTLEIWTSNFENALPEISKTKDEKRKRGISKEQVCVLCAIDRTGNIIAELICKGRMKHTDLERLFLC